ncbi:GDSL-type esterase/lipase family protein [Streptomyces sp. NPDC088719]|uniref:GDSL-type esterase/lipase family protein n=1 Tax=Streptomyces sp. NPDC088719 TaxID=3365872 RepID=UPI003824D593
MALLTTLLTVVGWPSPAQAAPPPESNLSEMRLATQNMQGRTSVWSRVERLAGGNHVVALQEVPHTVDSGGGWVPRPPDRDNGTITRLSRAGTNWTQLPDTVQEYEWRIGTASRGSTVYLYVLETINHPVGLITTRRAHAAMEVPFVDPNGNQRRNALVVLDDRDQMGYASFHAPAYDTNRGYELVARVAAEVANYGRRLGQVWRWAVLGDLNRHATDYLPPSNGGVPAAPYEAIRPLGARAIVPRDGNGDLVPTQHSGRTLDYMITNNPQAMWERHVHTWGEVSDHRAVMFGGMRAGAEPGEAYRFMAANSHPRLAISGDDAHSGDPHIEPWAHVHNQMWRVEDLQTHSDGHEYYQLVNETSKECLAWGTAQTVGEVNCDHPGLPEANTLWRYDVIERALVTVVGAVLLYREIENGGFGTVSLSSHPRAAAAAEPNGTGWHKALRMERVSVGNQANAGFPVPVGEHAMTIISRDSRRAVREQPTAIRPIVEGEIYRSSFRSRADEQWIIRQTSLPGTVNVVNKESGLCLSANSLDPRQWAFTHGDVCRATDPQNPSDAARMQAWEYVNGQIELSATGKKLGHAASTTPVSDMRFTVSSTNITRFDLFTSPDGLPDWARGLTVMPLGDSITLGVGSGERTGYRPALQKMLTQDTPNVKFVGSMQDADGTRHEGHSGWRIDQISANIERWMADAKPNLVLLHIGTNDMNRDYQVPTAPQRLAGLIDQIHASSPQTAIVIASLVPAANSAVQARVNAYNRAIPGIVADRLQRGYRITQVSMNSLTVADLDDTLHPNDNGYAKMASAFHGGVVEAARKKWIDENITVKPAPPGSGSPVAAGDYRVDINGDGRSDYLVVEDNGAVRAWTSSSAADGTVTWADQGYISSGSAQWTGEQVRFADVGGDARADYLILSPNGAVRAFINEGGDGRGGWKDAGTISTGSTAWNSTQVRFADVGGDAKADYLVVSNQGAVRAFIHSTTATGTVKWTDQGIVATGSDRWTAEDVRFADIGGDTKADYLIVDGNGAVQAYLNTTTATGTVKWANQGYVASGSAGWAGEQIRFADVTGDARAEYLILAPNGALTAYENTTGTQETTTWKSIGTIATGTGSPATRVRI